jgi:hypothetical protein
MGQIELDGSNSTLQADIIRGQTGTTVKLGGLLDTDGNYIQTEKGGDIASASPLVIDTDGDYFDVTGTVSFAAMTVAADRQFTLQFDGILTMTHHATNLDLPGEANITTAAGDVATFQSTASNTVQCINYTRADGTAIVSSHTPEGTAVKSTGEAGGTKFLREDGDNSCSWQTPDHDALTNFASNEHFTQANITATGTVASGTWNGTSIGTAYTDAKVTSVSGSTGAVSDGDIDHDSLGNFASNEHFTQANITATGTIATGVWNGTAIGSAYLTSASTTVSGASELATTAETNTGTDTGRTVTPDALAGSYAGTETVQAVVFEFATDTETGNGKYYFHVPASMNGMNLVTVHAEVITAGTTNTTNIQIHNATDGQDMLSTGLTIDSTETGSDTAATPAVINASYDDVATNDVIRIDVDQVSSTAAKGLLITMEFRLP